MKLAFRPSMLVALFGLLLVNAAPLLGADATEAKVTKIPFHGPLTAFDTTAQTITIGKTARVFHLTATTKITDGSGAPSTLAAATVGEDCGGSYIKDAAGTMNLFSVRLGAKADSKTKTTSAAPAAATSAPAPVSAPAPAPKPAAPPKAAATSAPAPAPAATSAPAAAPAAATADAKAKKQTFSGKVVSVDAAANTVVIHGKADQTFTVTSDSKLTGVASLAALTAGTKVSGTYTKSADGATLTVATLKTK